MIIDHTAPEYKNARRGMAGGRFNGAYYYSLEIVKNIIPRVKTTRNWLTINTYGPCPNHTIVFVHNNKNPENYDWLVDQDVKDIVLICGLESTAEKMKHLATTIYLPLSVDIEEVKKHREGQNEKPLAYMGRLSKSFGISLPPQTEFLAGRPRTQLLREVSHYKQVYAVGRCAIEAKILGCEVLPFDPRFPDQSIWQPLDNAEAAKILQQKLDEIDGGK